MLWCCGHLWYFLFVSFKFWNEKQNFVLNVWQAALANISIQGRDVDSYIYGLFHCSCHLMPLPAYNLEVVHSWTVGEA